MSGKKIISYKDGYSGGNHAIIREWITIRYSVIIKHNAMKRLKRKLMKIISG
jgi:hypothetical protein